MGYSFQFVTWRASTRFNHGMFELARGYKAEGMAAYSRLQRPSSHPRSTASRRRAISAAHRLFRSVSTTITGGTSSTRRFTIRPKPRSSRRMGSDISSWRLSSSRITGGYHDKGAISGDGGEFGSMNFHKLVEGSAQVQGVRSRPAGKPRMPGAWCRKKNRHKGALRLFHRPEGPLASRPKRLLPAR